MDPGARDILIAVGAIFCLGFAAMTIFVIAEIGLTVATVISLLIVGMIFTGLIGAFREPPQ